MPATLHHTLTESRDDNFCMRLQMLPGRRCLYTKAHSARRVDKFRECRLADYGKIELGKK